MDIANEPPRKARRLLAHPLIVAATLLLMVAAVHFPLARNFSRHTLPWMNPDTLYIGSVIEWNMHALSREWPALYHLNILYPYSYVTFFGHPLYGESLFFLLAGQGLGLDIHRSFVLYMFFSFWAGGLGCFLLARELSGRVGVGYLGAFLFILNPFLLTACQQLNVQSFYWSGFVLFFLVRLLRDPGWKSGLGLLLFSLVQGLFEIYHGFFILGITIPLFIAFAVALRSGKKKGLLILGASWLAAIALNVLMYLPFPRAIRTFELHRHLHFKSLITASWLLGPAALVSGGAAALFIIAFLARKRAAAWEWAVALGSIAAAFFAGGRGWAWGANALLLLFLGIFSLLVFRRSPGLPAVWKIGWGVMAIQLLVFFRFDELIPDSSLSLFGLLVRLFPMISGLRYLFRGVFVLIPLFVALAAAGLAAVLDLWRPRRFRWAPLLLALPLLRLGVGYWKTGDHSLPRNPAPYQAIEKGRDRILVEFPFWGTGRIIQHALYSINTPFHYGYLVNGRVAFRTDAIYRVFGRTETTYVPPRPALRRLLESYGVDYMIFHWDLARESGGKSEQQIAAMKAEAAAQADFVRVVADEEAFLVLRLKENFPLPVLRRSYSAFHLSRRDIVLELEESYEREIRAFLGRQPEITASVSRSGPRRFRLSFPDARLDIRGNPVEIHFAQPVRIRDIRLEKR